MTRRPFLSLLCIFILTGCGGIGKKDVISTLASVTDFNEEGCYFYARDVLALPGKSVKLYARVHDLVRGLDLSGITVEFIWKDKKQTLGKRKTDKDGQAEITWTPPADEDIYTLEAKITAIPDNLQSTFMDLDPTELIVSVQNADTPFMVIDMDWTLVGDNFFKVLIEHAKPMPDSQKVVKKLHKQYQVIYLTHRPVTMTGWNRRWLKKYKFPVAPLFQAQFSESIGDSYKYKSAALKKIRKTHPNLKLGIGDKGNDTKAYLENGMIAYWIVPYEKDMKPKKLRKLADKVRPFNKPGVKLVSGWKDIEKKKFNSAEQYAELLDALAAKRAKDEYDRKRHKKDEEEDDD